MALKRQISKQIKITTTARYRFVSPRKGYSVVYKENVYYIIIYLRNLTKGYNIRSHIHFTSVNQYRNCPNSQEETITTEKNLQV